MKKFILIGAFILFHFNTKADDKIIDRFIYKTNYQFQKVKDFQAKMSVRLNVPGLRMPKRLIRYIISTLTNLKPTPKDLGYNLILVFLHRQKIILTT